MYNQPAYVPAQGIRVKTHFSLVAAFDTSGLRWGWANGAENRELLSSPALSMKSQSAFTLSDWRNPSDLNIEGTISILAEKDGIRSRWRQGVWWD